MKTLFRIKRRDSGSHPAGSKDAHNEPQAILPASNPVAASPQAPLDASEGGLAESDTPILLREQAFRNCHEAILRHMDGQLAAAKAIEEMRSQGLFFPKFRTFNAYCEYAGISPTYAYALAAYARAYKILEDAGMTPLPDREGQTRPLKSAKTEDIILIWERARLPDGSVTGPSVKAAYDEHFGAKPRKDACAQAKSRTSAPVTQGSAGGLILCLSAWLAAALAKGLWLLITTVLRQIKRIVFGGS